MASMLLLTESYTAFSLALPVATVECSATAAAPSAYPPHAAFVGKARHAAAASTERRLACMTGALPRSAALADTVRRKVVDISPSNCGFLNFH